MDPALAQYRAQHWRLATLALVMAAGCGCWVLE
jgi:hypothetical protein